MNSADKAMAVVRRQVIAEQELALVNKRAYGMFRSMRLKAEQDGKAEQIDFTVQDLRNAGRGCIHFPCRWIQSARYLQRMQRTKRLADGRRVHSFARLSGNDRARGEV